MFDGLFDEPHDSTIRVLIYRAALVHAYSKLRIHTDATVSSLHSETARFADAVRKFCKETCESFHTTELRSELEKRVRRLAKANSASLVQQSGDAPISITVRSTGKKEFNANTAKIHATGDYPWFIVYLGSTESYSTANVRHPASGEQGS